MCMYCSSILRGRRRGKHLSSLFKQAKPFEKDRQDSYLGTLLLYILRFIIYTRKSHISELRIQKRGFAFAFENTNRNIRGNIRGEPFHKSSYYE